jgi:hypothetical protein
MNKQLDTQIGIRMDLYLFGADIAIVYARIYLQE